MSGPYANPAAEVAEMNRIHFELEYTEGISQRMRIPETLKVASENQTGSMSLQQPFPIHTTMMQVPERIIIAGEDKKIEGCIVENTLRTHKTVPGHLKLSIRKGNTMFKCFIITS